MQDQVLTLSEALKIFSQKDSKGFIPFDITYRTFNENTKMGGKLKVYKGAKYLPEALNLDNQKKSTQHFENRTRNIELSTGEIVRLRIDFIISVNGKTVIY
jgi:hypothetical protein